MEWEMSEEDQMLRAIAMSLGENVLVSTNQVNSLDNTIVCILDINSQFVLFVFIVDTLCYYSLCLFY